MDNPIRTADHVARMEMRRNDLRGQLTEIFQRPKDFVWEIGCGHGHFLTAYAVKHQDQLCVGIDIAGERIDRANRKREHAGLRNLHFVRAEAGMFLEVLPADLRVTALYVLFPDPWPKKRHHKHRLIQSGFLDRVAPLMEQHARLFFRTDYLPYFKQTQDTLKSHAKWQLDDEKAAWPFEHETVFQSRAPQHYSLSAHVRQV